MAIFGVTTIYSPIVDKFILDTKKRLESNNIVKNPFIAKIKTIQTGEGQDLHIVSIMPLYFNFSIFGWLIAFGIFLIFGFRWFMLPGIVLGMLGIFWRKEFYYWIFKKGLRKAGYTDEIHLINNEKIIEYICFNNGLQ